MSGLGLDALAEIGSHGRYQPVPKGDPARDWLVGVQRHPGLLIYLPRQRALFRALVGHARALA